MLFSLLPDLVSGQHKELLGVALLHGVEAVEAGLVDDLIHPAVGAEEFVEFVCAMQALQLRLVVL